MRIISIIPARMAASRFPGKPMAEINGMPMIGHVYKRVKLNKTLNEVYVATCDQIIFEYIHSIGGKAIMTSDCHERCSDRCAEAMLKIEEQEGVKIDIVVMVQGDEPLVHPAMIDESLAPMIENEDILVTNLMAEINDISEFKDPNEIKVVVDSDDSALYFSREPIPTMTKFSNVPMLKQVCIIPFRRSFLLHFNNMEPTKLEIIESIDMLRILENKMKVQMVNTNFVTKSVDTQSDLNKVSEMMKDDEIFNTYFS